MSHGSDDADVSECRCNNHTGVAFERAWHYPIGAINCNPRAGAGRVMRSQTPVSSPPGLYGLCAWLLSSACSAQLGPSCEDYGIGICSGGSSAGAGGSATGAGVGSTDGRLSGNGTGGTTSGARGIGCTALPRIKMPSTAGRAFAFAGKLRVSLRPTAAAGRNRSAASDSCWIRARSSSTAR